MTERVYVGLSSAERRRRLVGAGLDLYASITARSLRAAGSHGPRRLGAAWHPRFRATGGAAHRGGPVHKVDLFHDVPRGTATFAGKAPKNSCASLLG